MRVTVPDDLAEHYQAFAPERSLDAILTKQLLRFQQIAPTDRVLILGKDTRAAVETLVGASIKSAADLLEALRRVTAVRLQGIDLTLSPAQIQALTAQAAKRDRTVEAHIQATVEEALDHLAASV